MSTSRRGRWLPWLLVLGAFALLAVLIVVAAVRSGPDVPSQAVLRIELSGPVPERGAQDPFEELFGKPRLTVRDHLDNLEKAAADKRIKGVLLVLEQPQIGWAKVEELRAALAEFRKSGKFVVAHAEALREQDYALALEADELLLIPDGSFELNGLVAEVLHLPGLLEKAGIQVQYFRHGKFKSVSGETYGRKELTDPVKEMIRDTLDGQYQRLVAMVAKARKLPEEKVRELIDTSRHTSTWAKEHGLIDGVAYGDELEASLKKRLSLKEDKDVPFVSARAYRNVSFRDVGLSSSSDVVALVYSEGVIVSGKGDGGPLGGGGNQGSTPIIKALRRAGEDDDVKAVVFRVDSPGGAGLGCDLVRREVELLKKKKPVVVSMSDYAASGGYWVSMDASAIVAQPSTMTGSIGIWMVIPNLEKTYQLLGLNAERFSRGVHADAIMGGRPLTDDEAKQMDDELLEAYRRFVALAAKGRGKSVDELEAVAQGRTWSGEQALGHGLIDKLGGLPEAVALAKEKAGLAADKRVRLEQFDKPRELFERLFDKDSEEDELDAAVDALWAHVAQKSGLAELVSRAPGATVVGRELLRGQTRLFPLAEPLPVLR